MTLRRGRSLLNTNMSSPGSSGRARTGLSYDDIDETTQELLQRRPLEPHRSEVLKLRKSILQNFLKMNKQPYKAADTKIVLVNHILAMVSKAQGTSTTGSSGSAGDTLASVPEELMRSLPVESVELLRDMEKRPPDEVKALLVDYGLESVYPQSKAEMLKLLANLLSEQSRAQQGLDARREKEPSPKPQCLRPECCVCMEEYVSAGFYPCGHAIACMECASKLKECPMCRKAIENTLHLYFA